MSASNQAPAPGENHGCQEAVTAVSAEATAAASAPGLQPVAARDVSPGLAAGGVPLGEAPVDSAGSRADVSYTEPQLIPQTGAHGAQATDGDARRAGRFSPELSAAALATLVALAGLQFPSPGDWMATWGGVLELGASLWIVGFVGTLPALWVVEGGMAGWMSRRRGVDVPANPVYQTPGPFPKGKGSETAPAAVTRARRGARATAAWAALLLAICVVELLLHEGERNPFVATSRPESGVVDWTVADGYATLLDGHIAQGDGLFLLPMLGLFLGDRPPEPSEFDRRAGHVFLVSLLARPVGAYWAFAVVNLLSWWAASLSVWWLARRRWPGSPVPWIAGLLTATGQGFIFMSTAPQAHAAAFAAFALVLALADRLRLWRREAGLSAWLRLGWAAGAAGLIYLVYLPCLLFFWLYGVARGRLAGLVLATAATLGIVVTWERLAAALLGLSFSGGNNDLAGEALGGWVNLARASAAHVVGQLHHSSVRGLMVGAFYYPWWVLAAFGLAVSTRDARRWGLAVMLATALPAVAFTTRFNLPRVAYFMYPALYPLAAAGIVWLAGQVCRRSPAGRWVVVVALTGGLVALTNLDVVGLQHLALWFHHSKGREW